MIRVNVDSKQLTRVFGDLVNGQLDFALSKALNATAKDVQREVRASMPRKFTLRSTWTQKGIRFDPAKKYALRAVVGSLDDYMERQEEGGIKMPTKSKNLAIPVNVKHTRKGRIRKRDYPSELLKAGQYQSTRRRANRIFKIDETTPANKRHKLKLGIYAASAKGRNITLLYRLVKKAKVEERFGMEELAYRVVDKVWLQNVTDALDYALSTAR